jgi:hypothetical protein
MTINILDTLEEKQFEAEVHQVFQEEGNDLGDACRMRRINGNKTQFPVLGKLQMAERVVGTPLITSNQTATAVEVTTTKYSVSQYTDIFLADEVNFDAKQEAAKSVAMALGRQLDQVIIDALNASSTSKTVGDSLGGSADDLILLQITTAAKELDKDGTPGERIFLVHPSGMHHFLASEPKGTSIDYVAQKVLLGGKMSEPYYGFRFIMIGDRAEGGLPVPSASHRTSFAYEKNALGCAVGKEQTVEVNYVPTMGAHLVTGFLSAGSKSIDDTGIVKVTTDES